MFKAIGVIELKSIPKGIEATDAALKSAGVEMVSSHPACPGKYEIILTGSISNVQSAVDHVLGRYDGYVIDHSVMGRIDEQVIKALFGTQTSEKKGALETFSAATCIKAADVAVKTARVEIYDLRVSRGMGGKGVFLITGEIGDVSAAIEAGANYAKASGALSSTSVIAAPHEELWKQI